MPKERVGEMDKILCVRCGTTRHTIRGSYEARWEDKEADVFGGATYDLMECNGCQRGTLRTTTWCSEEHGESTPTFWPPREKNDSLREPRYFEKLEFGGAVDSVYRQTVSAFNNELSTLAGAGIRLLIEGICRDQKILKGKNHTEKGKLVRDKTGKIALRDNLEGKINGLLQKGRISKNQARVLHHLRKLGNDAAHSLDQPSLTLINECIDAIEHLMVQVYDQPELLKRLMKRKRPGK